MTTRAYPPEFCDAETMAYLLDMAVSTFREYVAAGILPGSVKIGNRVRWHRLSVIEALAGRLSPETKSLPNIMEAARGNVPTKKARRDAA